MANYYSSKNKLAALLLCFFLGGLGVHRFYIGRNKGGIGLLALSIVGAITTAFGFGGILVTIVSIWCLVDFICLCTGKLTDASGKPLKFGA